MPLGKVVVPGDSDLEHLPGPHQEAPAGAQRGGSHIPDVPELAPRWCFLETTTVSHFYTIDRGQEPLNYVTEITCSEIYMLDPELLGPSPGLSSHVPSPHLTLLPCLGHCKGCRTSAGELHEAAERKDFCEIQTLPQAVGTTSSCTPWSVPAAGKGSATFWTTAAPRTPP